MQVASELYNAVNNLGPVHESWMASAPQAAQGTVAAAQTAAGQPSQPVKAEGRRRQLLQNSGSSYESGSGAYASAPAAGPGSAAAAAFGPLSGPEDFGAFSPEGEAYTSFAKKKGKTKKAASAGASAAAAAEQPAAPGAVAGAQVQSNQHLANASPGASPVVSQRSQHACGNIRWHTLRVPCYEEYASCQSGLVLLAQQHIIQKCTDFMGDLVAL